eukprot:1149994-Pelagomonas_calceolata.AAC.1
MGDKYGQRQDCPEWTEVAEWTAQAVAPILYLFCCSLVCVEHSADAPRAFWESRQKPLSGPGVAVGAAYPQGWLGQTTHGEGPIGAGPSGPASVHFYCVLLLLLLYMRIPNKQSTRAPLLKTSCLEALSREASTHSQLQFRPLQGSPQQWWCLPGGKRSSAT